MWNRSQTAGSVGTVTCDLVNCYRVLARPYSHPQPSSRLGLCHHESEPGKTNVCNWSRPSNSDIHNQSQSQKRTLCTPNKLYTRKWYNVDGFVRPGARMSTTKRFTLFASLTLVSVFAAELSKPFTPQQRRWWAFQKVVKPAVPTPAARDWVANDVDAFVLAKLEEKHLKPAPPADKVTLIRRATLDLTGLLPTPEEVQAFVGDTSPDAFAKVVDRLLASPRYGERWARHWLDLARYSDSEGFKSDETRPNIWRYRDYVIDAFNQDKPYNRFVKEQIAGDELYPNDPAALIATGFNRHFPDESNARNLMQRRQELLNDITDTVSATFLGMTYGCARCHDHKFDPILHKDYYRLQAFFANTRIEDSASLEPAARRRELAEKQAVWEQKTKDIRGAMDKLLEPTMAKLYQDI